MPAFDGRSMLAQLVIRNFAIIDDLTVRFDSGLTAITGETGAGKSILIDALGIVLGGRAASDLVRTGTARATIDAEFDLASHESVGVTEVLSEAGIDMSDSVLVLTREIHATGRSVARINGRPVSAGGLGAVGDLLVDIHGQSEHLSLLRKSHQRSILDAYGVDSRLLDEMRDAVRAWRATRQALERVTSRSREIAQRVDLLRYQVEEIDQSALSPGEDTELERELARLSQVDKLGSTISAVLEVLMGGSAEVAQGDAGAESALRNAARLLADATAIDDALQPQSSGLDEIIFTLDDLNLDLRRYAAELEADPARLDIVSDRLAAIKDLRRKYGATIEDILAYREEAARELGNLTGEAFDEDTLRAREQDCWVMVERAGESLSSSRRRAASALTQAARSSMEELNLGGASFFVNVADEEPQNEASSRRRRVDEWGFDSIEFLFAPNPGETPRPLARIASGGEMARVMLALKAILADSETVPTLVFDEVDSGVGGRSGGAVGEKLRDLSRGRQVLVISHLPQVAAFADRHLRIRKEVVEGRTRSTVEELDAPARLEELAAMLDGEPVTEASRAKARELLDRFSSSRVSH
jgi:DNA repair protein RecN (Recombination protein N)